MNFAGKVFVIVVVFLKITTQTRSDAAESFDEGLIGCRFDGKLCKQHERCLDDDIFGRCVTRMPNSYGQNLAGGRKERLILGEEDLTALEKTFTFLKNSGAHWRNKETQCVLHYILNYFQTGEFSTPDFCDKLENILLTMRETSKSDAELYEKTGKAAKVSPTYVRDEISDSPGSLPEEFISAVDDFYKEDRDSPYALPVEIENNDSSVTLMSPLEQFGSIFLENKENLLKGLLLKRKEDGIDSLESFDDAAVRANKDGFGFKFERQERLDVKKPGPWFSVNNFAFADGLDTNDDVFENSPERLDPMQRNEIFLTNNYRPAIPAIVAWKKVSHMKNRAPEKDSDTNHVPSLPESVFQSTLTELPAEHDHNILKVTNTDPKMSKQEPSHPRNEQEVVQANYVFIAVKDGFETWKEGAQLVNVLAQFLKVSPETFNDVGVSGNQVSFRIMPNNKGVDPFKVVEKTDELRNSIRQLTGLEIDSIGIGDEAKVFSVLYRHNANGQLFNILVVCFSLTAGLAMVIVLWLVRRRWHLRKKLKDVASVSSQEISRDYQDLCRARMASKTFDGSKDLPRISQPHLSRESESSRSSTSSWCEEPVLTNMDISTGHMVLSYMEDHLRNRDRLDREWMALCAYEAEPCVSTETGSKAEFKEKNRYDDVLPYDHSRVILNSVANIAGFDYVNASLIADHDPRHPAYIAAQAPVAESVADFWQMIWEQGTVVLVLLTRLTENGKEECHLYWPTEGSQLYHIYEVHLVSEHIWCDDYLVRSFYLKNVRTGETRTVTQFHFLSWPENGVPASTRALLEFRRKINKSYRGRSSPILVHCSDGAGRTGTYCLIDMVLHRMAKGAREIDIAATLEHVRDQRMKAVRTKQQFEFVLTAVAEEVHAILRALPQ